MDIKYRWALMIIIGTIITVYYRVLTKDKKMSSEANVKQYTLFESTFKISVPFELTEKTTDNPNSQMIEKAWEADYSSKNGLFMALCYKLNPGVKLTSVDKGVELMLKNLDQTRDSHSTIESQDSIVINSIHFKRFIGTQKNDGSNPINKKANFNFEILTTFKSKYSYMIYFDENINTADSQMFKEKTFNSIVIQ